MNKKLVLSLWLTAFVPFAHAQEAAMPAAAPTAAPAATTTPPVTPEIAGAPATEAAPAEETAAVEEVASAVTGGVITFQGEITAPTCVVNGGKGGENFEVFLPKVASSELREAGKTAGDTKFNITLSNCGYLGGKVRANFQEGNSVDVRTGRLNLQTVEEGTAAENVQVELANEGGDAISITGEDQTTAYFPIDDNGAASMAYVARYYSTGKVKAGLVRSQVTYVLQYD